jgi:hypothetical protein
MKTYRFSLDLSQAQLLTYYSGTARNLRVTDVNGFTLQMPLEILRPFVTREGVHGRFVLKVDHKGKFIDLQKEGEA